MSEMTNEQKLAVAKWLPELIFEAHEYGLATLPKFFYWKSTGIKVTDKEWPYVMDEAALTLTAAEKVVYAEALSASVLSHEDGIVYWGYYPGDSRIDWDAVSTVIFSSASQRAEAFLKVKGEKV
jgi:hypothetical protein